MPVKHMLDWMTSGMRRSSPEEPETHPTHTGKRDFLCSARLPHCGTGSSSSTPQVSDPFHSSVHLPVIWVPEKQHILHRVVGRIKCNSVPAKHLRRCLCTCSTFNGISSLFSKDTSLLPAYKLPIKFSSNFSHFPVLYSYKMEQYSLCRLL